MGPWDGGRVSGLVGWDGKDKEVWWAGLTDNARAVLLFGYFGYRGLIPELPIIISGTVGWNPN